MCGQAEREEVRPQVGKLGGQVGEPEGGDSSEEGAFVWDALGLVVRLAQGDGGK